MPGILGVAGDGDVDAAAFLDRASSTLAHRPWYSPTDGPTDRRWASAVRRSAFSIASPSRR